MSFTPFRLGLARLSLIPTWRTHSDVNINTVVMLTSTQEVRGEKGSDSCHLSGLVVTAAVAAAFGNGRFGQCPARLRRRFSVWVVGAQAWLRGEVAEIAAVVQALGWLAVVVDVGGEAVGVGVEVLSERGVVA